MPECTTRWFPAGAGNSGKNKTLPRTEGFYWGGQRGSNARPSEPQSDALPTELWPPWRRIQQAEFAQQVNTIHNFSDVCSSVCRDGIKWLVSFLGPGCGLSQMVGCGRVGLVRRLMKSQGTQRRDGATGDCRDDYVSVHNVSIMFHINRDPPSFMRCYPHRTREEKHHGKG